MPIFEKVDDLTLKVVTDSTNEETYSKDIILAQIKGYEDQIAYNNLRIADLNILLAQANTLGLLTSEEKLVQDLLIEPEVLIGDDSSRPFAGV